MRIIPTRVHGFLDYGMGVLLIAAPWLFGFAHGGAETWLPVILGAGAILYSLFTDYELGLVRTLSMRTHLWLDIGAGLILALSPWIFDFTSLVWVPHAIFGVLEIGAGLMTQRVPGDVESRGRRETTAGGAGG